MLNVNKNRKVERIKTVRFAFIFPILFTITGLYYANVISSDKSYVKLTSSKEMVIEGESFSVDVFVGAKTAVNAVDISVKYSPDLVEITGVNIGESVLTIWTEDPKIEKNVVRFSGGTFKRGFMGEHLIGTINVKAKSTGQTELVLDKASLLAGDGTGSEVAFTNDSEIGKTSLYIYSEGENLSTVKALAELSVNTDIDGDGNVTLKDVSAFMSAWHSKQKTYDFNGDGEMGFVDFSIILAKSFMDL
ncbi:MAG: cohesin domain-containing protein [Candidatus Paceibacterota bacterium]